MRPSQVYTELDTILKAGLCAFIHGAPGIGKSQLVAQYAADHDLELRDIRASQLDPVDVRGVPVINHDKHVTEWFPPDFLPTEGKGILFLDELRNTNQDTQAALYQLILDGRVGDYVKPEGWHIVAASNRDIDSCFVQPMSRALKNRFIHLEMEVNYEDWHKWAHRFDVIEHVIAFMRFRPTALDEATEATRDESGDHLDRLRNANSFATPRSWEFTSNLLKQAFTAGRRLRDCYGLLEGTIGEGMASEFISYCDIYMELPDMDELIKDPGLYVPTTNPSKLYAICTGLASRANKETFGAIKTITDQMEREYAVWCINDCLDRNKQEIATHPAYIDWVHKNIEYAA